MWKKSTKCTGLGRTRRVQVLGRPKLASLPKVVQEAVWSVWTSHTAKEDSLLVRDDDGSVKCKACKADVTFRNNREQVATIGTYIVDHVISQCEVCLAGESGVGIGGEVLLQEIKRNPRKYLNRYLYATGSDVRVPESWPRAGKDPKPRESFDEEEVRWLEEQATKRRKLHEDGGKSGTADGK